METDNSPRGGRRFAKLWFALRMLEVRLRFVGVLVAIGLIIGYWETLQNYWDRWTRPAAIAVAAAGDGTEFYCPMDPSVIREGLEPNGSIPKCPICGMPLSLRKKGAPVELPPGVVSRVSLTPESVRMAGIETSSVALRPLARELRTVGVVAYDEGRLSQIVSRVGGYVESLRVDRTFESVEEGEPLAEIYSPEVVAAIQELKAVRGLPGSSLAPIARDKIRLLGIDNAEIDDMLAASDPQYRVAVRSPRSGIVVEKNVQQGSTVSVGQTLFQVVDLSRVWIEADVYEKDLSLIQVGQAVEATVEAYPNQTFHGSVGLIYPQLNTATRTARVRFEVDNDGLLLRSGMYADVTLQTAVQEIEPFRSQLATATTSGELEQAAAQKVCPVTGAELGSMGEPVSVDAQGRKILLCCAGCEDEIAARPEYYISRMSNVSEAGVLAVPQSAVIDTGEQTIVYVEREPGVFEGIEVQLGPESDGYYAVVSGLLPGDRVAAAGAFLVDAETRLNPAASASYFGASGTGSPSADQTDQSGQKDQPGQPSQKDPPDLPELTADQMAEIGQLPDDLQQLAQQQVLCPVTRQPLGSMGTPVALQLQGQTVLLCCKGCERRAERKADEMLETVRQWRAARDSVGSPSSGR